MFTTLQSLNKSFDPFSIGFDRVLDDIREITETAAKNVSKYPPYNIKKVNDKKWVIEMAVAGFAKSDIELTLDGNKLTVAGSAKEDDTEEGDTCSTSHHLASVLTVTDHRYVLLLIFE